MLLVIIIRGGRNLGKQEGKSTLVPVLAIALGFY